MIGFDDIREEKKYFFLNGLRGSFTEMLTHKISYPKMVTPPSIKNVDNFN